MGFFSKKTDNSSAKQQTAEFAHVENETDGKKVESNDVSDMNRVLCQNRLKELISGNGYGYVMKLYLENFKRLNDIFGYEYCEGMLSQIIDYIKEKTGKNVYRYLGVEFIIILDEYSSLKASDLAKEISERFNHVWKIGNTDCLCSIHIGLCAYPGQENVDELLKQLNLAIAQAENYGPNEVGMYDSVMETEFQKRKAIADYLEVALDREQVEIRYRPTYNIETKVFSRADLYMRIFIPGFGLIGFSDVIPIAEDSGQIRKLGAYALENVCKCIKDLLDSNKEFDCIALPISSVLLLQDDFTDKIKELKDKYKIPDGKLAIEINESVLTTAYLNTNICMQELSKMGVEIILNDFGSGYSGISSILELPINTLKLERLFVWQLETNSKSQHIIRGLIEIADNLGLNIIAEGVETAQQLKLLNDFKCKYQQGFYYSPTIEKDLLISVMGKNLEESRSIINSEKEKMAKAY